MKPVEFPEVNAVMKGDGDAVADLPVRIIEQESGSRLVVSVWELEEQDLRNIRRGGKVVLAVLLGPEGHPPVMLSTRRKV